MIDLSFNGEPTHFFANPNGTINQKDRVMGKFNRVAKLAKKWNQVEDKLVNLLESKYSHEAYVCLLMAKTGIRIGNLDSAEGYVAKVKGFEGELVQTFGATTLLNEHVSFTADSMILDFVGKKVVGHTIIITDPIMIKYGKKFYDENNSTWLSIKDSDVVKFIKKKVESRLCPKDFRTFAGNCRAYQIYYTLLKEKNLPENKGQLNKEIKEVITETAEFLGNTPGICKSAYLSPLLIQYIEKERGEVVEAKVQQRIRNKEMREQKWKTMNEERIAQGLPRKYRKRKKKASQ